MWSATCATPFTAHGISVIKPVLARYFGEARAQDKEPPSNREFCAALVEYLRQEACRL